MATAPNPLPSAADESPPTRGKGFLNPYVQIGLSTLLTGLSHILFKKGASGISPNAWFGYEALSSGWTWLGIVATITSLFSWLYALRFVPLNIAYNLTSILQVAVPLGGCLFFGEKIGWLRGAGIGLVFIGVVLISQAAAEAEEKL